MRPRLPLHHSARLERPAQLDAISLNWSRLSAHRPLPSSIAEWTRQSNDVFVLKKKTERGPHLNPNRPAWQQLESTSSTKTNWSLQLRSAFQGTAASPCRGGLCERWGEHLRCTDTSGGAYPVSNTYLIRIHLGYASDTYPGRTQNIGYVCTVHSDTCIGHVRYGL
jgi:hypothetical protein